MFRKILSALGMGDAGSPAAGPGAASGPAGSPSTPRIRAYRDESCNFIYNLLFCDDLALVQRHEPAPWMSTLLAGSAADLRALANDATAESRVRMLAFNRLREMGEPVPARVLLGTVLEVPVGRGLDTLAAFTDGDVRYINHTEKMSLFVGRDNPMVAHAERLTAASRNVVEQIGPWTEARLPPPPAGSMRITFLVSDGLYFGQGPYETLAADPAGGPVIAAGTALLVAITDHQQSA